MVKCKLFYVELKIHPDCENCVFKLILLQNVHEKLRSLSASPQAKLRVNVHNKMEKILHGM